MNKQDAEELIATPKIAHNWTGLVPRTNHIGHLIGSCQITSLDGIFIQGVTVTIEIKAPIITDQCLYLFSIMKIIGREKKRIYQLEICPQNRRSHNGVNIIYGPHEHICDEEPTAIIEASVNCGKWNESLSWFMDRINLKPFLIESPC